MRYARSLIATARRLAVAPPKKPRRSDLNRAVSTAYYAIFDALCWSYARTLVGPPGNGTPSITWIKVYRSVDHGAARRHLESSAKRSRYGTEIDSFTGAFSMLQEIRHRADYDPTHRITRTDALRLVREAEDAIEALEAAPDVQKQALAVDLLVKVQDR